jgi:hypothetical protein
MISTGKIGGKVFFFDILCITKVNPHPAYQPLALTAGAVES